MAEQALRSQPWFPGRALVWLVIVAPAIFDWVHGFAEAELGIGIVSTAYRGLILAISITLLIVRPTWPALAAIALYLVYIVSSYVVWASTSTVWLASELSRSINVVYLPLCVWILYFCHAVMRVPLDWICRQLVVFGKVTSVIIIGSLFLDIGTPTYFSPLSGQYGFGTQSYYVAGNVLGLGLVVSLGVALAAWVKQPTRGHYFDVALIFAGAFCVGSRTGTVIASLLVASAIGWFVLFTNKHRTQRATLVLLITPILVVGGIKAYELISQYSYMSSRIETLLAGEARASHSEPAWRLVEKQSSPQRIAGSSFEEHARNFAVHSPKKGVEKATAETDPVDILGAYGVAGLIVIYLPMLVALSRSGLMYRRHRTVIPLATGIGLSLIIAHSIFAGHVAFSSQSTQTVAILIFLGLFYGRSLAQAAQTSTPNSSSNRALSAA